LPTSSWSEPWITVNSPVGPINVCKVDEEYIEENVDPDFVEGDNWKHDGEQTDHPKFVPDHHIFISKELFKVGMYKVFKTFIHEYSEVLAMSKGEKYDEAHSTIANPAETYAAKVINGKQV
jgi:hypothetical protein